MHAQEMIAAHPHVRGEVNPALHVFPVLSVAK